MKFFFKHLRAILLTSLAFCMFSFSVNYSTTETNIIESNESDENKLTSGTNNDLNASSMDFSKLWIFDITEYIKGLHGVIGDKGQRIQMKFIEIVRKDSLTYTITGRSRVNKNICDFKGYVKIELVRESGMNVEDGDADYYTGEILGTYYFEEDKSQAHTGIFKGRFSSKFLISEGEIRLDKGWNSANELTDFIGEWQEYGKSDAKKCNFGIGLPEFFRYNENGIFIFDSKFINMGWNNYVYAYKKETIISNDFPNTEDCVSVSDREVKNAKIAEEKSWNF